MADAPAPPRRRWFHPTPDWLIGGLLAPLALVDPMLWTLPLLGTVFSWWALRRIKRGAPAISGGKMALSGLVQTAHTQVYVSHGLGAVFPFVRYNCRPEIALLEIRPA